MFLTNFIYIPVSNFAAILLQAIDYESWWHEQERIRIKIKETCTLSSSNLDLYLYPFLKMWELTCYESRLWFMMWRKRGSTTIQAIHFIGFGMFSIICAKTKGSIKHWYLFERSIFVTREILPRHRIFITSHKYIQSSLCGIPINLIIVMNDKYFKTYKMNSSNRRLIPWLVYFASHEGSQKWLSHRNILVCSKCYWLKDLLIVFTQFIFFAFDSFTSSFW